MSEHIEVEALAIEVDHQPIELFKVIKLTNVVGDGGEAKMAIADGYVGVNGELETRKRRKIYDGDVVAFNGDYYVVICPNPVTSEERPIIEQQSKPAVKPKAEKAKPASSKSNKKAQKPKRKPISF